MRDPDRDDLVMSFEDRLREWSRRSPNLPTSIARTRVLARLPEVSRPVPWLRLAAAAALVVVLVVAVWRGSPHPAGEVKGSIAWNCPPPLDRNIVVWQLDDRTTVYFALRPGEPDKGGVS
jgi:hypothetical protein